MIATLLCFSAVLGIAGVMHLAEATAGRPTVEAPRSLRLAGIVELSLGGAALLVAVVLGALR